MLAALLAIALPAVLVPNIIVVAIGLADFIVFGPPSILFVGPFTVLLLALAGAALIANQLQLTDPSAIGLIAL
jgi:hypothetical protein